MKRIAILLLVLSACSDPNNKIDSEKTPAHVDELFTVDTTIELGNDESAINSKGQRIRAAVLNDSRCPTGVECVWEGEAKVQITIQQSNGNPLILVLSTRNNLNSEEVWIDGRLYRISVVSVLPYPKAGQQIPLNKYRVVLDVKLV